MVETKAVTMVDWTENQRGKRLVAMMGHRKVERKVVWSAYHLAYHLDEKMAFHLAEMKG